MSSRIGSQVTLEQARSLGAVQSFQPHGTNRGQGVNPQTSGNGSVTQTATGSVLNVSADTGYANSTIPPIPNRFGTGRVIIFNAIETNQAIGNLANGHRIGVLWRGPGILLRNNEAMFLPSAGQSTSGNITVLNEGTRTDGTITYPTLNDGTIFLNILVDNDQGQTEFYIQKNPLTAQPDATIDAVPAVLPIFGAETVWGGDGNEELTVALTGYICIP